MPTWPAVKIHSVMKRWRQDRAQPVRIRVNRRKEGAVKTLRKCCSKARNEGVSCMGRLPCGASGSDAGYTQTTRPAPGSRRFFTHGPRRNLRNSNLEDAVARQGLLPTNAAAVVLS